MVLVVQEQILIRQNGLNGEKILLKVFNRLTITNRPIIMEGT